MDIPHTETACIKKLQDIISETSILFYNYIIEQIRTEINPKGKLVCALSEKNLIDSDGNISKNDLENHCRLVALIGLLQQTAEQKINKSVPPLIYDAYKKLPEDFRYFLKLFSDSSLKKIKDNTFNDILVILEFPSDIIGNVYNKFSYNTYQQIHGQHFTQTAEADILNAFCIKKDILSVFDGSCGSGVFLVRAFYFFQYLHSEIKPNTPYSLTGIDISSFATYFASINFLFRQKKTKNNSVEIITDNFLKINVKSVKEAFHFPVDVCVGNPPFIRHEMMKEKKEWHRLIKETHHISYISKQSDLYIYFLIHAASMLKTGGRLGWVISASWLDVQFGTGLQRFLLEHFKIITIIDYQAKRSFETASVNTVLLVIEKCEDIKARKNNLVKFVRVFCDYEKLIGRIELKSTISSSIAFAKRIENISRNFSDENIHVDVINQQQLENDLTSKGKYENGHWGAKYLRSPAIYNKIISLAGKKMIPLSEVADVKYGIKTGANDFFYLIDETYKAQALPDEEYKKIFGVQKKKHMKIWDECGWYLSSLNNEHFIIEKEFVIPVFKTQKEANKLDVDARKVKFGVLNCKFPKSILKEKNKKILAYIHLAEKEFLIHTRPSVLGRGLWYNLSPSFVKGDFIFPSKIGEKYRLIDNRNARIVCDKVNYAIIVKEEWKPYADDLFLILNSITFRYFIDLFSRQLTGSQTLSDVDVNLLKKTLIPHPVDFRLQCENINALILSIKSREQLPLSKEILQADKFELDLAIGKALGLKESDIKELYKEAALYVEKRQIKSDSLKAG